jgi:hypothetical protein
LRHIRPAARFSKSKLGNLSRVFNPQSANRNVLLGDKPRDSVANVLIRLGADEWIVLLLQIFRATSMPNGVSNALSIILIGAISKARFPHL